MDAPDAFENLSADADKITVEEAKQLKEKLDLIFIQNPSWI